MPLQVQELEAGEVLWVICSNMMAGGMNYREMMSCYEVPERKVAGASLRACELDLDRRF